jgi:hypothetical protein
VQTVLKRLREYGVDEVIEMEGEPEETHFRLPDSLLR